MKKYLLALSLVLVLLISACGARGNESVPSPEPVSNQMPVLGSDATEMVVEIPEGKIRAPSFASQTYVNETIGFALDYPLEWVQNESVVGSRTTQVVFVSSPELFDASTLPEGGSRLSLTIYDWDPKNDLAAYVEKTKTAWDASGFIILEEEAITLDLGLAAVRFTVQTPELTSVYLITTIGDKYLVLAGEGDLALVNEILLYLRPISQ